MSHREFVSIEDFAEELKRRYKTGEMVSVDELNTVLDELKEKEPEE
jgi:hypothetical protein